MGVERDGCKNVVPDFRDFFVFMILTNHGQFKKKLLVFSIKKMTIINNKNRHILFSCLMIDVYFLEP